MSSYFDTMARCVDNPRLVAELVARQFDWYLRDIADRCASERQLERFSPLRNRGMVLYARARKAAAAEPPSEAYEDRPGTIIQDLHTLAHDLGEASIKLHGGRRAGDNPPIPY